MRACCRLACVLPAARERCSESLKHQLAETIAQKASRRLAANRARAPSGSASAHPPFHLRSSVKAQRDLSFAFAPLPLIQTSSPSLLLLACRPSLPWSHAVRIPPLPLAWDWPLAPCERTPHRPKGCSALQYLNAESRPDLSLCWASAKALVLVYRPRARLSRQREQRCLALCAPLCLVNLLRLERATKKQTTRQLYQEQDQR